jgi:hypothetical protein
LKLLVKNDSAKSMLFQKDRSGANCLQLLIVNSKSQVCFSEFLGALENVLDKDELQKLLTIRTEKQGSSCLAIAASHSNPECLESFWSFMKIHLNSKDVKEVAKQTDDFQRNVLMSNRI